MKFATQTSARALAIMIGTGIFTITGNFVAPQHAYAFGLSDITGVVEDVWEIGADATERAGRAIGNEARKIGRGTITSNNPPRRRVTGTPTGGGNTALPPSRGSSRPTGNTALPPARGTASNAGSSLPTGNTALPPARGTAKPTGDRALPPPRRPNETVPVNPGQRPTPITEEDIKPPFCNSKFENCSGEHGHGGHGHGHHDHHDKKGQKAKKWKNFKKWSNDRRRDKSVWGNPAGHMKKLGKQDHQERTLQIKRNDNKRVKIRVNTKKRDMRIQQKSNRRG